MVDSLAEYLARTVPGQRGFTRRNLFRMRQFFETYRGDAKVTPLVTQLPWTHNLIILSQAQRPEEREFYLRMAAQERWSKRELERQFRLGAFKDVYAGEFLNLPAGRRTEDEALRVRAPGEAQFLPRCACHRLRRYIRTPGLSLA